MKKLLVVIDMINGFVHEGALSDKKINKITPQIIKRIEYFISQNWPIIAFKDAHTVESEEFKIFPVHCLKGTSESQIIPELASYEKHFKVIEKDTTNGFDTDEFKEYIKQNKFSEVEATGCCTDICVENFVVSLKDYFNQNKTNTAITVSEDSVYTFDNENHNAVKHHNEALARMQQIGVNVVYENIITK